MSYRSEHDLNDIKLAHSGQCCPGAGIFRLRSGYGSANWGQNWVTKLTSRKNNSDGGLLYQLDK